MSLYSFFFGNQSAIGSTTVREAGGQQRGGSGGVRVIPQGREAAAPAQRPSRENPVRIITPITGPERSR